MLLNRMQEKLKDRDFYEYLVKEKNKKLFYLNQLKENNIELMNQTLHTLQIVDGVSLWEVNRKLKRLAKTGISEVDLRSGKVQIPLSIKKSNTLATQVEIQRIEQTIDELEGFEELRLHYFYHYKPIYHEKKMFGEITRWIEIKLN